MTEQVVRIEKIDRQVGKYHVTGTLTLLWDPEAAKRIKAKMVDYMLAKAPEILARARARAEKEAAET